MTWSGFEGGSGSCQEILSGYTGLSKRQVTDLFCNETGFQTLRVVALHDKDSTTRRHPYGICKVFFLCEIVDGEFSGEHRDGRERMVFPG